MSVYNFEINDLINSRQHHVIVLNNITIIGYVIFPFLVTPKSRVFC